MTRLRPAFYAFFLSLVISKITDEIAATTTPLFLDDLTGEIGSLVAAFASFQVAHALVSVVGGAWADRLHPVTFLIRMDALTALSFLGMAFVAAFPDRVGSPVLIISLLSAGAGFVTTLYAIGVETVTPMIVSPAALPRANSFLAVSGDGASLLGPALAGVIVASFGFASGYLLNVAGAIAGIAVIAALRGWREYDSLAPTTRDTSIRQDMREGVRFLAAEPTLIRLTVITSVANVFGGFLYVSLPIFMRELAGTDDTRIIALGYSVLGFGGLIGAGLASNIVQRLHAGRVLLVSFALFTVLPAAALIATDMWLALTVLGVVSATGTVAAVTVLSVRQRRTPRDLLGRVAGITRLFIRLALPAGSLVAGALVPLLGFRNALLTMGLAGVGCSVLLALSSIKDETFDAFDEPAMSSES